MGEHLRQHLGHEAGQDAALGHARIVQRLHRARDGAGRQLAGGVGLDLDVQLHARGREELEHLGQRGHAFAGFIGPLFFLCALPFAQARGQHLGRIVLAHRACAFGGAVEQRIVDDHGLAVARFLHVEFDRIRAQRDQAAEAAHAVLGPEVPRAAVSDDDHFCNVLIYCCPPAP